MFQVFCSQKWSMVVATTLNLLLVVFACNCGAGFYLLKPSFDWYDPNHATNLKYMSLTLIRVLEALMSVGFLWMIR